MAIDIRFGTILSGFTNHKNSYRVPDDALSVKNICILQSKTSDYYCFIGFPVSRVIECV